MLTVRDSRTLILRWLAEPQVVRRQGCQDEAIALLQEWLAVMDASGLSLTAGQLGRPSSNLAPTSCRS